MPHLQVSGLVYAVAPGEADGQRICGAWLLRNNGRLVSIETKKLYTVALNDYLLHSSSNELGDTATKILEQAAIVIQPGEGAEVSTLLANHLQRRAYSDSIFLGRVSIGCLPRK